MNAFQFQQAQFQQTQNQTNDRLFQEHQRRFPGSSNQPLDTSEFDKQYAARRTAMEQFDLEFQKLENNISETRKSFSERHNIHLEQFKEVASKMPNLDNVNSIEDVKKYFG